MAGTAITDWAQSSGNTVSYNAKNNSINVSGSSYNVGDIAAGKVSGLSYKAGHVYVDNPSAITKNIISNSQGSIGLGENRQEQLTNYDREQTLAAECVPTGRNTTSSLPSSGLHLQMIMLRGYLITAQIRAVSGQK